jgi:hypothetical protein
VFTNRVSEVANASAVLDHRQQIADRGRADGAQGSACDPRADVIT